MFHPTIIASGICFKGTMTCKGDCIVYGHVEGDIMSEHSVLIKADGCVQGTIRAPSVVVEGLCEAKIHGDIVKILPRGHLKGDVESALFIMYPQALFEGIKRTVTPQWDDAPNTKKLTEFDTENILL